MRCERPYRQYISQLQQCRRCSKAEVRCITTLEAERRDNMDAPSQRSRKRRHRDSMEANGTRPVPHALRTRLDEQHHEHKTPQFEHRPEHIMTETLWTRSPSILALPKPEDGMLALQDTHDQRQDLGNMVDCVGISTIYGLGDDQTRAISGPPTSDVPTSLPNSTPGGGAFMEVITASSATVQSTAGVTFPPTSQESHGLFGAGLSPLSSPHLPGAETSPTEVRWTITNKLMEFNTNVLHDLHNLRGRNRVRGDDKGVLMLKTLQYSDMILELLPSFTRSGQRAGPGEPPGRSSPYSSGSGSAPPPQEGRLGPSTSGWGEKVDTDLALLLLSCNMNVSRLYELLCTNLTMHSGMHMEEVLLSLRMEGLKTLDAEMRVQVLVHICFLKFTKIQTELETIRRLGLLTETADKAFQVVLGNCRALSPGCPGLGVEQIVDQLRRRVTAKGEPSS